MAKVLWSHHGDVFEFPAQLTRIELNELRSSELGKASLSLMIYENDGETPLLSLDATSTEGLIVPTSPRRISHPALGHVGIVSDGYLLGSSQNPSLVRLHRPYSLDSHEPENQRDESYSSIAS